MDLTTLGWNQHWQDLFTDHAAAGFAPARVVTEDKHYYTVVSDQGPHLAQIVGRLLHLRADNAQLPKVGDWVAIRRPEKTDRVSIEAVLPRKSTLDRKIAGRAGSGQVLAANIDVALVVAEVDLGELRRLRRLLRRRNRGLALRRRRRDRGRRRQIRPSRGGV
jgi:ribosome biogenesis GTPase